MLGIDDAETTKEGQQTTEPAASLLTFSEGHLTSFDLKTLEQFEADLIGVLKLQLAALAPGKSPVAWKDSGNLVADGPRGASRSDVPLALRACGPGGAPIHSQRSDGRPSPCGASCDRQAVPVVQWVPPRANGRLTILMNPRGKAALASSTGKPLPLTRTLLGRGHVVGFDPLLIGETFDPVSPASCRPEILHFDTCNPVLAADRIQDLARVLAQARIRPGVLEVSLIGERRAACCSAGSPAS